MGEKTIKIILFIAVIVVTIASIALYAFAASVMNGQPFRQEFAFYLYSWVPRSIMFTVLFLAYLDDTVKEKIEKSKAMFLLSYVGGIPIIVIIFCLLHKNGIWEF